MNPHIAIFYEDSIPSEIFDEFYRGLTGKGVPVRVIAHKSHGPMAGVEWYLPTFVVGFIASSYFGGFLQEMGKDHYILVKEQFKKLYQNVAGPDSPDIKLVGSEGKLPPVQQYSLFFSLLGEAAGGLRLKLLLRKRISQREYDICVDTFLDYLRDLELGTLANEQQRRLELAAPIGKTILVVLDEETHEIVPIDPRTGKLLR